MTVIFHITSKARWKAAVQAGSYRDESLEREGFIHCSKPDQVKSTANRFFKGQTGLALVEIEENKVDVPIRYEEATVGEQFPHLYGPLNLQAVNTVFPFEPNPDGCFSLPDELSPIV